MNPVQLHYSDLLRLSSFNDLDGDLVADWLESHPETWKGFVIGRPNYRPLIILRDIPDGYHNADTLHILCPTEDDAKTILAAAENEWQADEYAIVPDAVELIGGMANGILVRVWWD